MLLEVHGPRGLLKMSRNAGMGRVKRETGEVLAESHKPQQPEVGGAGGVPAPQDCSAIVRAVSSVLTLKAIQSEVCILVSSDVTANH